jgi:hypothetical protein
MAKKTLTPSLAAPSRGLSLIELMIAIAIGMALIAALLALFVNVTRTNNEMTKMNRQIENGRFAIQLLQDDIVHAGYWGSHVPQFDDLTTVVAPLDAPNAIPDPCLDYASWTDQHRANLIGVPVQADTGTCGVVTDQQANTDTLVVRYAHPCALEWDASKATWMPAGPGCEADTAGKLYFQSTLCEMEVSAVAQQPNTATTIKLNAKASPTDDYYNGAIIRIIGGAGAGQSRKITDYDGLTRVATVDSSWGTVPDNSSTYAFGIGRVLDTSGFIYHERNCSTPAAKRKFVSNLYYIRDYAVNPGDGIPTLMRSSFDLQDKQLNHHAGPPLTQPLIEGIEGFRVQFGVDTKSDADKDVNYTLPVVWADPMKKVSPTNRGDGIPESYFTGAGVTCTGPGINQCRAANVVAVRIHVLARSLERTPGYVDSKTYRLGDQYPVLGPFNDNFKRHVFSTTVRLVNPAGRRDTP